MDDWDEVSDATPQNSATGSWDAVSSTAPQGNKPRQPRPITALVPSLPVQWKGTSAPALKVNTGRLPVWFYSVFSGAAVLIVVSLLVGFGVVAVPGFTTAHIQATATMTAVNISATQTVVAMQAVQATTTAQADAALADATATVSASQTVYTVATSGTPSFNDPLTDNRNGWKVFANQYGSCGFTGGAYHLVQSAVHYWLTCASQSVSKLNNNFAFQTQINIVNGDDAGMVFSPSANNYYKAYISSGGSYLLIKQADNQAHIEDTAVNSAIHTNQVNVVTVIMDKGFFSFFVNGQYMSGVYIGAYSNGSAGLSAEADNQATDVAFSAAKLWTF